MSHEPSVLLVDDDERFRSRLARAFEKRGWDVRTADSAEAALAMCQEDSPEHAVVDLRMPGEGGLWLVERLAEVDPSTNVVVLTGFGSIATAVRAVKLGASNYLTKPVDLEELLRALKPGADEVEPPTQVASLARAEWEHIQRVLDECDGNISQAARLLGIHRRSLQRKLSKMPVSR